MAIKSYATKAAYEAATLSTIESQVSMIETNREIIVDGVNIVTTEPVPGDVLFLDESNNKAFLKGGDWLKKAIIPTAWTLVGYVFNREGRKVKILDKAVPSVKYAAYAEYSITAISSTSITIKLRLSNDYASDTSIDVTLADTSLNATNAQAIHDAIVAKCTEVSATNVPWAYYDETNNKIVIVVSWNDYRQYNVSGTGCTIALTIWDDMPASDTYFKVNRKSTNYRGIMNIERGVAYWGSNGRTPSSAESTGVGGNTDPVKKSAFESSEYCSALRAAYSSYSEYIEKEYGVMYPQHLGAFNLDAKELTQKYGNRKVILANGTEAYAFPALHHGLSVGYNCDGLREGEWYTNGAEDGTIFMRDDIYALVRKSQGVMGSTQLSNSAYRWFAQRYNVNYAWYFGGYIGNLNTNYVYHTFQVQAVALLEI